jgi:hypothetical protein
MCGEWGDGIWPTKLKAKNNNKIVVVCGLMAACNIVSHFVVLLERT